MLSLLAEKIRDEVVRLVFIDTTTLFPETYDYKDQLCDRFSIEPITYSPHPDMCVDDPASLFEDDESDFLRRYKHNPTRRMVEEV